MAKRNLKMESDRLLKVNFKVSTGRKILRGNGLKKVARKLI